MNEKIKLTIYQFIGLFVYSFGVSQLVFSGLGSSPIDAASYYMNKLVPIFDKLTQNIPTQSGQGVWITIFNILIALGLLTFSKRYNIWINIIMSVISGLFINLGLAINQSIFSITGTMTSSNHMLLRILVSFLGINFMSFGIGFLAQQRLFGTPFDELTIELEKKVKKYYITKIILDGSFLLIAIILGLIYKNVFEQIGLFTVVVLSALGPLINIYINLLNKFKKGV